MSLALARLSGKLRRVLRLGVSSVGRVFTVQRVATQQLERGATSSASGRAASRLRTIATAARPGYESSVSLPHKNQHQQRSLSLAAYPNPHASPLAQRARKAETGPDAVLKLAQRTRRTTATRTAADLPAPGRVPGVQTATPETSSSGGRNAPPAAHERTRMPGTITTRPPESGRYRRGGRTPGRTQAEPP